MFLKVVFTLIKFLIEFGLNPAIAVVCLSIQVLFVCLFIQILFVCLFTYFISIISWSLKLEQITRLCQLYHAYFKVSNIIVLNYGRCFKYCLYIDKIFNRVWIESSLRCLFVYIDIVCLFVYIDFVCLFGYIFHINNQLDHKACADKTSLLAMSCIF